MLTDKTTCNFIHRKWGIYIALALLACFPSASFAQYFPSVQVSPYSGVTGVNIQPALLANSTYTVDFNLISATANGLINEIVPKNAISNTFYSGNNVDIQSVFTTQEDEFFINAAVQLPSFSLRINDVSGIAFTWRIRAITYGIATNRGFSILANSDFDEKAIFSIPNIQTVSAIANTWQDIGLNYGRNIYDKGAHKIDVGLGVSYLVGGAGGYLQIDDLNLNYNDSTNTISEFEANITVLYNQSIDDLSEGKSRKLFNSNGYGFNFGVIYEFQSDKYLDRALDRKGEPNYLLRASVSVLDIGRVYYSASANSAAYSIKTNAPLNGDYFSNLTSISDLTSRLDSLVSYEEIPFKDYSLRLPFTLNMNVDWHIWKAFFANAQMEVFWVDMRKSLEQSATLTKITLSGRWEREKFGIYISTEYDRILKLRTSMAARYSIIQLGVSNLISFSSNSPMSNLALMAGLRLPLLTKSKTGKNRIF